MYSLAKRSTTAGSMPQTSPVRSGVYGAQASTRWSKAVRHATPSTVKEPDSAGFATPLLMAAASGAAERQPPSIVHITKVPASAPASPCAAGAVPMEPSSPAAPLAVATTAPSTVRRYAPSARG